MICGHLSSAAVLLILGPHRHDRSSHQRNWEQYSLQMHSPSPLIPLKPPILKSQWKIRWQKLVTYFLQMRSPSLPPLSLDQYMARQYSPLMHLLSHLLRNIPFSQLSLGEYLQVSHIGKPHLEKQTWVNLLPMHSPFPHPQCAPHCNQVQVSNIVYISILIFIPMQQSRMSPLAGQKSH